MAWYRKKPVVIEARQVHTDDYDEMCAIVGWCDGTAIDEGGVIAIDTLEGRMIAQGLDYIIKGVKGEFYPCKPDIFAATYEATDASEAKDLAS